MNLDSTKLDTAKKDNMRPYSQEGSFSSLLILIPCFFIVILTIFVAIVGRTKSDFSYNKENIQVISNTINIDEDLAKDIVFALEKTSCLTKHSKLHEEDVFTLENGEYEIYMSLMIRLVMSENQFKIYTFKNVYNDKDEATILLYDSSNPESYITLSEEERNDLIASQRRYQVVNTIQIIPRSGILVHDRLGNSSVSFTVKNVSNTTFSYIQLKITPGFLGHTSDYKTKNYSSYESIFVGQSKEFNLTTTGWTDYDLFTITEVVIYFSDGSSILFNEYDCQFLSN